MSTQGKRVSLDIFAICEDNHRRAAEQACFERIRKKQMHVISKKKLREFWNKHPRSRIPLEAWYQLTKRAFWENFAELRATFPSADRVGRFVVFDIGGNKYRLIAAIHFNRGKLFVRHALTHAEYEIGNWKGK